MMSSIFSRKLIIPRFQGFAVLALFLCIAWPVQAEFAWAPDQHIGSTLPSFSLPDDSGEAQHIEDLLGDRGMVLMFIRSADW